MTQEEMNILALQAAGILSGYEGEEMFAGYDGSGDPWLDFEGRGSFRNEIAQNRTFMFSLTNSSGTPGTVYLNKGYSMWGSAGVKGLIVDGAFTSDDAVPANMTAVGMTNEINELRAFAFFNPCRVLGFKMQTTEAQIDSFVAKFKPLSPFKDAEERFAYGSWYVDENTFRERIVTIPFAFDMNDQNRVKFVVLPNTTINFTLLVGGILNSAGALDRKAQNAVAQSPGVLIEHQTKPLKLFGNLRTGSGATLAANAATIALPQVTGRTGSMGGNVTGRTGA